MPQTVAPFVGWFRPNKRTRWTRLAEGGTHDEAWGRLLDALASMRGGESVVLRAAEDPNAPPPHTGRRQARRCF